MKLSIRWKLFIWVNGLIIVFVLLTWCMNKTLLDKYYYHIKRTSLIESYNMINDIYKNSLEDISLQLELMERAKGIRIVVVNDSLEVLYDSVVNRKITAMLQRYIQNKQFTDRIKPGENETVIKNHPNYLIRRKMQDLMNGEVIFINISDLRLKTDFINLVSRLENGHFLILSTPAYAVEESAVIANRFSLFTGLLTIITGSILVLIFSRKFTNPILELDEIAREITKLNFGRKYKGNTNDEVGTLGKSINSLSEQLSKSINKLMKANKDLKKDIQKEREIDEMRKEFISNVSHELKTPIALIQGYAEGLKVNINENKENKNFYCDVIMDETEKMNNLVGQLLHLSYMESKHLVLDKTDFDICKLINKVLGKNTLVFKVKNIIPSVNCKENIMVNGARDNIEQILMNYITNAVNYVDYRKVIRINVQEKDSKIRVTVFNSGKHIPGNLLDKIWISFYKVDKARKRTCGSTGLGLSIVKAIQEQHGNDYGVKNVDDGVEFWFDIDKSV